MSNNVRINSFSPVETKTISASTSSARGTFTNTNTTQTTDVRIVNATSSIAFFKQGGSTVVATSSDTPIPAGAVGIFTKTDDNIAVILASGSGSIYVTSGIGA